MTATFVRGAGESMRENSKVKGHFEPSLGVKKAAAALAVSLVLLGGAFALGSSYGAKAVRAPASTASKDPLAPLDEPITAAPKEEESLGAHEALTAARPEALPVVKPVAAAPLPDSMPTATREMKAPPTPNPTLAAAPLPDPLPASGRAPTAPPTSGRTRLPTVRAAQHGVYTIQVASVPHRADAEKLAKGYRGRHPRVVAADVPGKGRVWRVQVGSYPTRAAATRGLAALGAHGYITAMR
jgi:DedD protein